MLDFFSWLWVSSHTDVDEVDFHCCAIFICVGTLVNKVEAIYGRLRFNVKVDPRSTITFTRGLSGIHWRYFICAHKNYATVEIHPKRLKCCSRNRDDLSCLKSFLLLIAKCERRVSNRPFPHYAPVNKHKEIVIGLGWTISYKSLYFVHPSLELVPLFTGMRERSTALKVYFLGVIIHSQIVWGWNELKWGFGFSSHLLCPLKIRLPYVLGFMVSNTSTNRLSGLLM